MNREEVKALRKAFEQVKERQKNNKINDLEERKKRLRKVREQSIINEELLKIAIENLEKNGINVFLANDKEEAIEILLNEIDDSIIVKSKSNVAKEIELTKELEKRGIEVVETDIGDRIMQLLRIKPSHPTGPIAHLSANTIAEKLSEIYGIEISRDPEKIIEFVKKDIYSAIERAKIGITGANAISAEEGSIALLHNEGNIFKVAKRKKHIILTGIDKVYPNLEEIMNMLSIQTFYATGARMPSFIEIISGVSKTADIEKKFFLGIHEPSEIILILLDNGRKMIANSKFRELLYCIGCGNCLHHCPMFNVIGNEFAEDNFLGGRGVAYYSLVNDSSKKLEYCLSCGKCKENCPLEIDTPKIIRNLRSSNILEEIYHLIKAHAIWAKYRLLV